jgi:hypothetical protein
MEKNLMKKKLLYVLAVFGAAWQLWISASAIASPDDVGCCIIEPQPIKTSWSCFDKTRRDVCEQDADDSGSKYEFFKDKRCKDFGL